MRRVSRFYAVGALGIAVQMGVFAALLGCTRWDYRIATAAAVEAAVLHNFVWHERWTWADRCAGGTLFGRLCRFHAANGIVSLLGNVAFMHLLAGVLGTPPKAAGLAAIALCSILNFAAADRLVFAARRS